MIKWSENYRIGIDAVDDQHKELFRLTGELSRSIQEDSELDKSYLVACLEVYSLYHFTSEEHLMAKYNYPDINEHIKEHKKFRIKILALKAKYLESTDKEVAKELAKFLEDWLQKHTIELDRKYLPYIKSR